MQLSNLDVSHVNVQPGSVPLFWSVLIMLKIIHYELKKLIIEGNRMIWIRVIKNSLLVHICSYKRFVDLIIDISFTIMVKSIFGLNGSICDTIFAVPPFGPAGFYFNFRALPLSSSLGRSMVYMLFSCLIMVRGNNLFIWVSFEWSECVAEMGGVNSLVMAGLSSRLLWPHQQTRCSNCMMMTIVSSANFSFKAGSL